MYVPLQIIAVTVFLLLAQETLRRSSRWFVWGLFLVLPILLTPYWIRTNELGVFPWFKFYTVFFCVCWGTLLRFSVLGDCSWARSTISLLLAVNILEAVVLDLVGDGPAHALNAATGLLLIATLPYGKNSARIDSANRYRDMLYGTSLRWVIGYTLWNWTFVYLNYPSLTGHHTAVLAAGLIVTLHDPGRWAQTRASTLGVNLLGSATFFNPMIAWMDTSSWFDEHLGVVSACIGLAFMTTFAVLLCRFKFARVKARWNALKLARRAAFARGGFLMGQTLGAEFRATIALIRPAMSTAKYN